MLNKEEIFKNLKQFDKYKEEFVVLSGASLVVQGMQKETTDIDLAVSEKFLKEFSPISNEKIGFFGNIIYEYNDIEYFTTFYDKTKCVNINGYYFCDLEEVLRIKKLCNRKSDQQIIKDLDLYLCKIDNLRYEKELYNDNITLIAGVDEVGRGPLVGPVVTAAVILPKNYSLKGLTDSKKLSEKKREEYAEIIKKDAISYAYGIIDNNRIDEINIYEATKEAMIMAIKGLNIKPEHILIDAMKLDLDIPSTSIIKGDIKSISISAASVLAKVYRDHLLYDLDKKYPYYNFKNNKGYPTKDHINAINEYGIIEQHRKTYGPVAEYIKNIK